MPPPTLYLNEMSLADYGLYCYLPQGWGDAPRSADTATTVPGHAGGILLTHEATVGTREVIVEGMIYRPEGDLRATWDDVKRILASPILEMRFAAWPDRMALARYQGAEFRPEPGHSPDYGAHFALRFLLANPYLLATTIDVYAGQWGQRVQLIPGTAPSRPDIVPDRPRRCRRITHGLLPRCAGYIARRDEL